MTTEVREEPKLEQPRGRLALVNGRIILPQEIVTGQAVMVEAGKIVGLGPLDSLGVDMDRLDVGGRTITPGLIDLHTHGALNHTFNEATPTAFDTITELQASRGVTTLLATTMTDSIPNLVRCLEFSRQWLRESHQGAQVLGVHVEGPYFCQAQRGAQDPAHIRNPDDGTPAVLLEHADVIKIMTYAPELPGALALTTELVNLGIIPAAGHSNAQDQDVLAAMKLGLRHIIHIWSAQSSTVREGPWRKPGLLEASLTFDGLTVEMITDNKHLPPTLMKLAYKCLGPDRLCAISDATSGAGLPEGSRFRMGGLEYEVCDGVGMMLDRSAFAGSTTLLNQMVPILTEVVGIPLVEAVRMVSLTPARVIGCADRKGSLAASKDADLAIFEADFSAWRTMIGGQWVFDKNSKSPRSDSN
ncbi:MAG: N-acetylglucosamine-6-phosphate deacetylase [Anaerolineae bacterium]|nr:N-acetylglucosamine-6-phosphate deacetylase [Anaerolineae bacterium]